MKLSERLGAVEQQAKAESSAPAEKTKPPAPTLAVTNSKRPTAFGRYVATLMS